MLLTGLFIDHFGGVPNNETVLLFGAPNSGKTLLTTYIGLRFLEQYPGSYVIYIDADKKFHLVDIYKLSSSNNIPTTLMQRISITPNPDAKIILNDIADFIANKDPDTLFVIVDSLPSISYSSILIDKKKQEHIANQIYSIKEFIVNLSKLLDNALNEYYLLLIDQVSAIIGIDKQYPAFWTKLGFIPKYWDLIHISINTNILIKKIRRGLFFLRVISSDSLPEISGIIKIESNLKIT